MNINFLPFLLIIAALVSCKGNKEVRQDPVIASTDTSVADTELQQLNALIAANPGNAAVLHDRAKLYMSRNEFANALADVQKALQYDSTKAAYFITLSDLQLAANKPSMAKASLEKSLSLESDNAEANMKLGELYFIARQYDKVFTHVNNVLKNDIHNAKAYMMKGMAYKELGDTAKAISNFKTSVEQDPKYYPPLMQLGIIYMLKNDPLALQYYNAALAVEPASQEALYGRAMWYQENVHDYDKAIQDYTSIIQLNPKNKNAHFNLGFIHYEYLKVFDQAIKHYTDAINADSNYAEAYYNRGLTYESVGNIAAAKADYEKAIAIRPGYDLAIQGLNRVKM